MEVRACMVLIIFSILALHSSFVISVPTIPSFMKICHRSDPNLNSCVRKSVNLLRPYLKDGIPSLGVPPCEPLVVPKLEITQSSGPVSLKSRYTNLTLKGGSNFGFKSVRVDLNKDRIRLKLFIPRLEMIGNYYLEGKILMLPISGEGVVRGNYTDLDVIATFQMERYDNPETEQIHYRVTEFYVDFDVGHVNIYLDNLFNGDEALTEAMNIFLNDNWQVVMAEMKPKLEESIAELFKDLANKIFSQFPIDTLLPP